MQELVADEIKNEGRGASKREYQEVLGGERDSPIDLQLRIDAFLMSPSSYR